MVPSRFAFPGSPHIVSVGHVQWPSAAYLFNEPMPGEIEMANSADLEDVGLVDSIP